MIKLLFQTQLCGFLLRNTLVTPIARMRIMRKYAGDNVSAMADNISMHLITTRNSSVKLDLIGGYKMA